jgi:hypothetical protein
MQNRVFDRHRSTQHNDIQHNDTQRKGLVMTLIISHSITILYHYSECHYPECGFLYNVMLNIFMLSVIMLNVMAPADEHVLFQAKTFYAYP